MRKLIIITMLLLISGCSTKEKMAYEKIDTTKAISVMKDESYQIIDVRTEAEYNEEHIKDAINIPHTEIKNIDIDKNTTIFVYCKSGARSKMAADTLLSLGYKVYDLGAFNEIDLEKE